MTQNELGGIREPGLPNRECLDANPTGLLNELKFIDGTSANLARWMHDRNFVIGVYLGEPGIGKSVIIGQLAIKLEEDYGIKTHIVSFDEVKKKVKQPDGNPKPIVVEEQGPGEPLKTRTNWAAYDWKIFYSEILKDVEKERKKIEENKKKAREAGQEEQREIILVDYAGGLVIGLGGIKNLVRNYQNEVGIIAQLPDYRTQARSALMRHFAIKRTEEGNPESIEEFFRERFKTFIKWMGTYADKSPEEKGMKLYEEAKKGGRAAAIFHIRELIKEKTNKIRQHQYKTAINMIRIKRGLNKGNFTDKDGNSMFKKKDNEYDEGEIGFFAQIATFVEHQLDNIKIEAGLKEENAMVVLNIHQHDKPICWPIGD